MKFTKRPVAFLANIALALAISLATASSSAAQGKPTLPPRPVPPKSVKAEPSPVQAGAFAGFVNGQVAIVQREPITQPTPGNKRSKIVSTFDLKGQLAELWNVSRNAQEIAIKKMIPTSLQGHDLYDVKVTLATAGPSNKLYMSVNPQAKQIALTYTLRGNKITCKVDAFVDASISATFDLDLNIMVRTNGPASAPIVLTSANLYSYGALVFVNGERKLSAESALNFKRIELNSQLLPAITLLNSNKLGPYLSKGYSIVTPTHSLPGLPSTADLLLVLDKRPLASTASKK